MRACACHAHLSPWSTLAALTRHQGQLPSTPSSRSSLRGVRESKRESKKRAASQQQRQPWTSAERRQNDNRHSRPSPVTATYARRQVAARAKRRHGGTVKIKLQAPARSARCVQRLRVALNALFELLPCVFLLCLRGPAPDFCAHVACALFGCLAASVACLSVSFPHAHTSCMRTRPARAAALLQGLLRRQRVLGAREARGPWSEVPHSQPCGANLPGQVCPCFEP